MEGIWRSSGGVTYDSQTVSPVHKGRRRNIGNMVGLGHFMKNAPRGMHLREKGDCPETGRPPTVCPKWIT